MDRSNGAYSRTQNTSGGRVLEARTSAEQTSPRLHTKKSNPGRQQQYQQLAGPPATTSPQLALKPGPSGTALRASTGTQESQKVRKGSLRNAVRRIFGRRSREADPPSSQISPPRHGYHRSEPAGLPSHPEETAAQRPSELTHKPRTFSTPLEILPPPAFQRTRSPYAVEFPQSARLKPLALGDPFSAPGSQLRRRKTLPSVLLADVDSPNLSGTAVPSDAPPVPSFEEPRDATRLDFGTAASLKSEKRKSRSAGDLRAAPVEPARPERKRSDEIRYWRESFQGSVLRASGFRVPSPRGSLYEDRDEDQTPLARAVDPFVTQPGLSSGDSPPVRRGQDLSENEFQSPSALGTQLSQDLEDRVGKLEANIHNFQAALDSLAADRHRRTVLIGGVQRRPASSSGRTASMLAETLQYDLEPSGYQYDYTETQRRPRPSTSPQPPRTPPRPNEPSAVVPSLPMRERAADEPYNTPAPGLAGAGRTSGDESGASSSVAPQYTFRSLYEMLADERSARRKLETQMRDLSEEIAHLHQQVSLQSNVQSQRSSFAGGLMMGSSRLQALLRETETSRPGTAHSQSQPQRGQQQRDSGATGVSSDPPGMVSRFSGSESEVGMPESSSAEELQTPYEAYETPRGEQGRFDFGLGAQRPPPQQRAGAEGEMF